MQHDADMIDTDPRGFCHLFVGEVLQEKSDDCFFKGVQPVEGRVKVGNAIVSVVFGWLPRFNRPRQLGVFKIYNAARA